MVLRSPLHPNRKGGKPESLSPEPLFSKTGTQGDTLPPSSGTQWPDLLPAGWQAQGCWPEGLLPQEAPHVSPQPVTWPRLPRGQAGICPRWVGVWASKGPGA